MLHRTSSFLLILSAATIQAATLSIESAPNYAIQHNPQLKAAAFRIEEARARVLGAGRLTNPELETDFSQNTRSPERTFALALMQRFPVTARLTLEKRVTRAQLAAAEAEVRDARRRIAADTRSAAIKYVAIAAQQALREEQLKTSDQQADFVRKRVGTGEASVVDASQVELESQQLGVEIAQLELERAKLSGELRALLGVPASTEVHITGELAPMGRVPARQPNTINRPDLEAARHNATAAREEISLARARAWDDIGAGVTASAERMEDAPEGLSNDYFLGFRVSIPLPFWNKNQGGIAAAEAAAARAEKEVAALSFAIGAEAETARGEMRALRKVLQDMDDSLLPKASAVEDQLRAAYIAGQTPLTEVLRARARRLELLQRRIDALRDFHLAKARWEAAIGKAATGGPGK